MNRRTQIITRAAELIKLDERGTVNNLNTVCDQLEREFETTGRTAFNYVKVAATEVRKRQQKPG